MNLQYMNYEKIGRVARIALSRPERINALNGTMLDEIGQAVSAAESDNEIRAVVLTGEGKAFFSGFDLKCHSGLRMRTPTRSFAPSPLLGTNILHKGACGKNGHRFRPHAEVCRGFRNDAGYG